MSGRQWLILLWLLMTVLLMVSRVGKERKPLTAGDGVAAVAEGAFIGYLVVTL